MGKFIVYDHQKEENQIAMINDTGKTPDFTHAVKAFDHEVDQ
jgi:hypothetical protein